MILSEVEGNVCCFKPL